MVATTMVATMMTTAATQVVRSSKLGGLLRGTSVPFLFCLRKFWPAANIGKTALGSVRSKSARRLSRLWSIHIDLFWFADLRLASPNLTGHQSPGGLKTDQGKADTQAFCRKLSKTNQVGHLYRETISQEKSNRPAPRQEAWRAIPERQPSLAGRIRTFRG